MEAIEGGGIKETAAAEVLVVDLRSPEEKILFEYLENLEINDSERIECKVDEAYKSRWLSKIASIQTGTTIKYTPYDTDMSIQPTQPHSQNKMR